MKRMLAFGMMILGGLILAALVAFIVLLLDYRHSFTSTDVPAGDFLQGLAMLSPIVLIAGALVYFGFRWRKA